MMQTEFDKLQYMEPSAEKLEALELLFKKYKSVLHPRHFVMITIKYALIELYGRVPGYEMDDLPDVLLERKENLCRDILKVSFCFIALKKCFLKFILSILFQKFIEKSRF